MKLISDTPPINRVRGAAWGGLKGFFGLALLWAGMNSLLIGRAYGSQKGSNVALAVGGLLVIMGVWVLAKGVRQVLRSMAREKY